MKTVRDMSATTKVIAANTTKNISTMGFTTFQWVSRGIYLPDASNQLAYSHKHDTIEWQAVTKPGIMHNDVLYCTRRHGISDLMFELSDRFRKHSYGITPNIHLAFNAIFFSAYYKKHYHNPGGDCHCKWISGFHIFKSN